MTFKTTQSNRFKPASYEPKPMPKQQIWMHETVKSKTGGLFPAAEITLMLLAVFVALVTLHYLGVIKPA